MQKLIAIIGLLILAAGVLPGGTATLQRKTPEFAISEPGKQTVPLSSFRGKVVVMEFLFVRSEHCLRVARILNKLQDELGSRGFQPVGVVFDPPNTAPSGRLIAAMTDYFKLTFPVGYATKDSVDTYLGRAPEEILNIPQVVVIDRAGRIRATSGGRGGDPRLEQEASLRNLINDLLKEDIHN